MIKLDQIKQSIIELCSINSVQSEAKPQMPFGEGVYKALEYTLNLASEMGFETVNYDGYVGEVIWRGKSDGKEGCTLGILCHLDVVKPGRLSDWKYDPFTATEENGKINFFDGVYTVKVYLSNDGSTKEGLVTTAQFTITNSQAVPTVTQDKKTINSGDAAAIAAGTPDSLTNYFTISANGAAGTLSVEAASARQIGTTLLVESITIRETFADGNYIAHKIVKNFTLSVR